MLARLTERGARFAPKDAPQMVASDERWPMMHKVEALLAEAHRPWAYAHAVAKHMFNRPRVDHLTPRDLHKLIAALMADARRHGRRVQ